MGSWLEFDRCGHAGSITFFSDVRSHADDGDTVFPGRVLGNREYRVRHIRNYKGPAV